MKLTETNNPLNLWYGRLASGKAVIVFFVAFLVSQATIVSMLIQLGDNDALMLQLTFSRAAFIDTIQKWGQPGIEIYRKHFWADYPHAFIYSGFLASVIAFLTVDQGRETTRVHLTIFSLPFVACLCDLVENTLHLILISNPDAVSGTLVKISATMAWVKWGFAGISIVVIVLLVLKKITSPGERSSVKK